MDFTVERERETDGRWIAEVPELAGGLGLRGFPGTHKTLARSGWPNFVFAFAESHRFPQRPDGECMQALAERHAGLAIVEHDAMCEAPARRSP